MHLDQRILRSITRERSEHGPCETSEGCCAVTDDDTDRRREARTGAGIRGTGVILASRRTGNVSIVNLSSTGALLVGDLDFLLGEPVKLLLHVDGHRSFGINAQILRAKEVSSERHEIAVAFVDVPAEIEGRIQSIVIAARAREQISAVPAILVVDDDRSALAAVEQELAGSGRKVLFASTALEVVRRLQDQSVRFEAALVELDLSRTNPAGVLSHLADEYPKIRRIAMSRGSAPARYAAELTSGRAQVFLRRPWEPRGLLDLLGAWPS